MIGHRAAGSHGNAFRESLGMQEIPISEAQAVALIRSSGGKLFSVVFEKRTKPGVLRRMVARLGVSKGVNGEGQRFDPAAHSLVTVAEFVTQPDTTRATDGKFIGGGSMGMQFRHIPFEGIRSLRLRGVLYKVVR